MAEHTTQTLFFGYQTQAVKGTPATGSHRAFGTGNGEIDKQNNVLSTRFIGSAGFSQRKGGGAITAWSFNADAWHDAAPLQLAVRDPVTGVVSWNTVSGGWDELTDKARHLSDAKAGTLNLRLAGGPQPSPLSGSTSGLGRKCVENAVAEVVADPPDHAFMTYEGVFDLGGVGTELDSFETTGNNNLRQRFVIAAAARTAGEKRFADYFTEGAFDGTGTLVMLEPYGSDVHADVMPAGVNAHLRLVNLNGGSIIDLLLAQTFFDSHAQRTPNDGEAQLYSLPFVYKQITIASA